MGLLEGKTALVFGLANDKSIAWGITQAFHREGAKHAKKTRRTPSVGSVRRRVPQPVLSKKIRCCLCEKE